MDRLAEVQFPSYFWGLLALGTCVALFPYLNRDDPRHRLGVSAATITAICTYLTWRALFTLAMDDAIDWGLAILFFVLELGTNLSAIIVMIVLTRRRDRTVEADTYQHWVRTSAPSVAIFIATYNENATILNRTIIGALHLDYKADIYLLDDGRRPEIAELCRLRGVNYLTRNDNRHAKAGNMNAGLQSLIAAGRVPDFIAILDADFVPMPDFLSRSLALFHDPGVGLVQTPQHFFNPDPFQHSLKAPLDLPDEQRFFFDTLLPAKDGWDAAFSCGTSSIVRTSALLEVGGFPTDSITEDMLLSMRLKGHGHRTAYLNEKLSLGLAPEGLSEYCTQRIRWCVGAMQIVQGRDGILSRGGLTLTDRANLFDTLLYWVGSFPFRIACLLIPILYWFTGRTVMQADLDGLATFLLPKLVIEAFAIAWYSKGRLLPLLTDASQLTIAPEIVMASFHTLFFPGERPFKVTNKGGDRNKVVFHWWMMWRFLAVMVLTAAGMAFSYITPLAPAFFSDQKAVVAFWSVYNILVCAIGMLVCVEQPRRSHERTLIGGDATFVQDDVSHPIRIADISANGVGFDSAAPLAIGIEGAFHLPFLGSAPGRVVRKGAQYGAEIDLTEEQQFELIRIQFSEAISRTPQIGPLRSFRALVRGL